ncbi:MAG: NFACT family protein [Eubacteriales bacterium]
MPFDAVMLRASICELRDVLLGARVEKVTVPEKEEVLLSFHTPSPSGEKNRKLAICTYPDNSCVHLTSVNRENPSVPSGFCLVLRKNLIGARVFEIEQLGFERAIRIGFRATDEMGYPTERFLVAETMGKYSNLILLSNEKKVILASRLIELSLNSKRPVLPGMTYEPPPAQNKRNPLTETPEGFDACYDSELAPDKLLMRNYYGISPLISRETAYQAENSGNPDRKAALKTAFFALIDRITDDRYEPTLLLDASGTPVDYSFEPIRQYGDLYRTAHFESVGAMLDRYAEDRNRAADVRRRAADLLRTVSNAEKRLNKKIQILSSDLEASDGAEQYRALGELITANIYQLKKGMSKADLIDYSADPPATVTVPLDVSKTPQQLAAGYFKKYNKLKAAKLHAAEQLRIAREELEYIERVADSLNRADGASEIAEIRSELEHAGYIRSKSGKKPQKPVKPTPDCYRTSGGYTVYCGKNNIQNEYITFRLAHRGDLWFHAKNIPGSHVLLIAEGAEPSAEDYTEAAMIAAVNSSAKGTAPVEVDYTHVENVKKPSGSRTGFVIYRTNYSTTVLRDEARVKSMKL